MAEPKYTDGRYHIEQIKHEYLGGYVQSDWTLVNIYGEPCIGEHGALRFVDREAAQAYCDRVNITPDGGVVTNFI